MFNFFWVWVFCIDVYCLAICWDVIYVMMRVDMKSFFFFKQKTAYEMRISDWSSDVCSSDLLRKAVDAYNGANQHTKDLYIEQIQREPKMARAVGQLIGERELILQRDRGMSL